MKQYFLLGYLIITFVLTSVIINPSYAKKGKSTEITHQEQVLLDDIILEKNIEDLTPEELARLKKIQSAQEQKRSLYEKRAIKKLSNGQPKTYSDYEKMSIDVKTSDLEDFNPKFQKDPKLAKVPMPEFQVTRYNYPAGSREINLNALKSERHVNSQGVLSPDGKTVVYSDVDYVVSLHKTSSNVYLIPVKPTDIKVQRRKENLLQKENELYQLTQDIANDKMLSSSQKRAKKEKLKKFREEVEVLRKEDYQLDKEEALAAQNDTPAQKKAKALMNVNIKDKIKTPILSTGLYETDYGVQRTLTVVDWSEDSNKILLKEKIAQEKSGLWQTNIWVYDVTTKEAIKLDAIRQAIEYYWNKDRIVDLYYYHFDIYPLGWDAQRPDKILLYAFGYSKKSGNSPKFLGTWSIDSKNEKSQLISILKTGFIVQANGFCLKAKNLEYYER